MNNTINLIQKQVRAQVIKKHLKNIGENKCVCFSCGNASQALKNEGLEVIEMIEPLKWWGFTEIQKYFKCFDATSGHLPIPLLIEISNILKKKKEVKNIIDFLQNKDLQLPTGSGETLFCLKLAFPTINIFPVYDLNPATKYNKEAPMNIIVDILKGK